MNGEWKLIRYGFLIAVVGATAAMLMIVGLSASYVGKFPLGIASLASAACLAVVFRVYVRSFLNSLDQREADFAQQVGATRAEESGRPPLPKQQ